MTKLKYDFINEDHKRMHNALTITFDNYQRTIYYKGKERSFSEVANIIESDLKYINKDGEFNTSFSVEELDIIDVIDRNPDDNTIENNRDTSTDLGLYTDNINTKENIANRFMQIFKLAELQDKEFAEFIKNNDSNTYNYVDMYFDFLAIDRGLK